MGGGWEGSGGGRGAGGGGGPMAVDDGGVDCEMLLDGVHLEGCERRGCMVRVGIPRKEEFE